MKCISGTVFLVLLLSHQYNCYTEDDLAEALWSDTNNMLRRSEMNDICRFLLRRGDTDIDPSSVDRLNLNLYKSLYALLAYINEPLLEDALLRRMESRCRVQLQEDGLLAMAGQDNEVDPVYKRSEGEKVVGKKVKFHAWGGKRTGDAGDVIPNPVYRAKFHSWGGRKRSVPEGSTGQDKA